MLDENDEELDKLEEEELNRRKEQLEKELEAWSSIKYYARELQQKETMRKLDRINKRIEAKKRELTDSDGGARQKRRRKLEYPIIEENLGEQTVTVRD